MEVRLHSVEPGLIHCTCRGALGHSDASNDPLRALLSRQSWEGNVLLDLHDVDYIGTSSIAWLVHWHRWVTQAGGVLGLCSLPAQFKDLFRLCHLQQLIPIWDNAAAARAALTGLRAAPAAALTGSRPTPAAALTGSRPTPPAVRPREADGDSEVEDRVLPMPVPAPATTPGSTPDGTGRAEGRVVKVLVVDDSAVERRRAGFALEKRSATGPSSEGGLHVLYANNGREALEVIRKARPSLVVTDLVMPELDGLGLVKEIRLTCPSVPVVLMTAHGSEEVAAEALRAGAASYVPKKYLARDLRNTVETILHLAQHDREQLVFPHLTVSEHRFLLPTDLSLVSPLVDFLQGHLQRLRLCHEVDGLRVALALGEAVMNAFTHGSLEAPRDLRESDYEAYLLCLAERQKQAPYKDRQVHVIARETPQEVVYTVRDEGPGFDTRTLPDPTSSENFKKATGRGLYLIRTFMDEVKFNDDGNEITLIKRRRE
jgi:anti-anti-sigma factor